MSKMAAMRLDRTLDGRRHARRSSCVGPRASAKNARSANRAFTVLELLIVLMLITLTATVSISAYFGRSEVTLENAARLVAEDLRMAQDRASFVHLPVAVVFASDGGGYSFVDDPRIAGCEMQPADLLDRRFDCDAVFEGVRIERIDFPARDRVLFNESGAAVAPGVITITYRGEERRIEVEAGRGAICVLDAEHRASDGKR